MPRAYAAIVLCVVASLATGCGSKDTSSKASASATSSPASSAPAPGSTPMEKFADAICACKDEKCAESALAAFEAASKQDKRKPDAETPAEKAAADRAEKCMDKILPGDGK